MRRGRKPFRRNGMAKVSVRYIVDDVDAALVLHGGLGFKIEMRPAPGFRPCLEMICACC